MDLDRLWQWDKRKLACRIRQETGNPAADDLRERLAELAGVNLKDLLEEMRKTKTVKMKKKDLGVSTSDDYENDKKLKEVLNRSHVLGATQQALDKIDVVEQRTHGYSVLANKNFKKQFTALPKSPPRRVLIQIQMERSKPFSLPDQDDNKTATARLERKLAKQRAARKAGVDRLSNGDETGRRSAGAGSTCLIADQKDLLPSKWGGDLFNTMTSVADNYLGGMIYLSRMADSATKTYTRSTEVKDVKAASLEAEKIEAAGEGDKNKRRGDDEGDATNDSSNAADMGAKLYCATALCNWARNPSNANRLATEGAVRAIIHLALEPIPRICFFCAGAFRFMSDNLTLATAMIDDGAISVISDIIKLGTADDSIIGNLTIALVNLTRVNGKECQVVEAMIHQALMNILTSHPDLGSACARGLYNLTCVDSTYPLIEKVIRALIQLSSTSTANVKHICAAAICNLADLKSVRLRLVEEGVISVLGTLSKGSDTRTRRVCAVILQNLSASKSCRVEMVSRSSVQAAHSLSSDPDPVILRCIGLAISRLSTEPSNSLRIIHELGIAALCNIAVKYPTVPGISQPVATAFQLLSSNQSVRVSIVQEGSVAAIASLLRFSSDIFTLQHCLLALCNLLSELDNHLSIVQQGLIVTLISLSVHENDTLKDFCALAFLNLSCSEDSRKHAVNAGSVVAIINLAGQVSTVTKARCAAALCNLSALSAGMERMVSDGVIPALVSLVRAVDLETVRYACAALCRLCSTMENGNLILESGAVPNLVERAIKGDAMTQQFCGAVLSSLSFYESCRVKLCDLNMISALKNLSNLSDDVTKQRCLVAFANLSCEVSIQIKMVDQGVVEIISNLADSYQEINFICCAKALCNLACAEQARLRVAKEGGMHALMMISMVRSVDRQTKLLCIIALTNLLDETTVDYMLEEGLVGSVAQISKMPDQRTVLLCATLFNQLTFYPAGRVKMAEKAMVLHALFAMVDAEDADTKIIAARTTSNLVLCHMVRGRAIEAGALRALETGMVGGQGDAPLHCLKAVFSAAADPPFLEVIACSSLPKALTNFAAFCYDEKHDLALKILCLLAWNVESRVYLQTKEFVEVFISLITTNLTRPSSRWMALTLRYLCLGYGNHQELLDAQIVDALVALKKVDDGSTPHISQNMVEVIRCISSTKGCEGSLANAEIMAMLKGAADICCAEMSTLYSISATVYNFSSHSSEMRSNTACADTAAVLLIVNTSKECTSIVTATICHYLSDPKSRAAFATKEIAAVIIGVMSSNPPTDLLCNAISCVFALSKRAASREFLLETPLHVDVLLSKLSQSEDLKIKANCARTLKNMTSDSTEALEEGAVANLIAMSLEGKEKIVFHEKLIAPEISPSPMKDRTVPEGIDDVTDHDMWFNEKMVIAGGAAGKGPDSPEPPSMSVDGSSQYPSMMDEQDTGETEGKTKMAFAKMQTPQSLKESYLLTDADFETIREGEDASVGPDPELELELPALQITEVFTADNGSSRSTPQWRDSDEDSEVIGITGNRGSDDRDREWEQTRESKSEGRERERSKGRESLDLDTLSSLDDDNTGDIRSHMEDKPSSASTGRKRPDPSGQGQSSLPGAKLSQKQAKSDKVKMKIKVKPRGGSAPSLIHSVETTEFTPGQDKDYSQKYRQKKVAESATDIFVEKAATLGLYA